ncbi:MAG: WD40/YVTN/BNR-like repeat-containing protein, partial [Bacteroidia bacterium]
WVRNSVSLGDGIYKSTDGGATWKKLSNGIPAGNLGRIGLAVSPADANVVYATIESKETAMYRSNDKGETWTKTGTHNYIIERPFYFTKLIADPKDPNRIYRAGLNML